MSGQRPDLTWQGNSLVWQKNSKWKNKIKNSTKQFHCFNCTILIKNRSRKKILLMNVHQKNLLWDEGVLSGPFFCRCSFFKQSPSPVALQARNPLVSCSKIMSSGISVANPILLNHFWIFDWLLLFYPMGNLIVFVGERFTIALFFLAALGQNVSSEILNQFVGRTVMAKNPFLPSSNSNWNSNNQGHQVIWSSKQSTHTRPPTQFSLTPSVSPRKWNKQL